MRPSPETSLLVAADWLARGDAGLSPDDEQEFQAWLEVPEHAIAWWEVRRHWAGLDRARGDGHAPAMMHELATRAQRRRMRWQRRWFSGLAAAAVLAVGFFLWPVPADRAWHALGKPGRTVTIKGSETSVGDSTVTLARPDLYELADGTVVELNADALLSVSYTEGRRDIRLIRGEAHFTVAHDAGRPFYVRAGAVEVQAVGTAFAVEANGRAADVLVTEGRVGIVRFAVANGQSGPLLVAAGGRVLVQYEDGDAIPAVEMLSKMEMAHRLQWRGPKLRLAGAPLAEVVKRLNQMNRVQLAIGDPALADLRFSGTFQADNVEGFVRVLAGNYEIKAEETIHETIVLRHK